MWQRDHGNSARKETKAPVQPCSEGPLFRSPHIVRIPSSTIYNSILHYSQLENHYPSSLLLCSSSSSNAAIAITLPPNWGNALVCISWFFLELALCILIVSCNGCYGFAILAVLLLSLLFPSFSQSWSKQ